MMHRDVPAIRTISRQTCGVVLTRVLNAQNRGYLELPPLCTEGGQLKLAFFEIINFSLKMKCEVAELDAF